MNNVMLQLQQQQHLLHLEYEYEKTEYEELCRKVGISKRIKQGKCWFPLTVGRTYYNALNQLVVEVSTYFDDTDNALPEHEFEPGKPVAFFQCASFDEGGSDRPKFMPYTCQVSRVDVNRMQITVPSMEAVTLLRSIAVQGHLGIQISFDATSHRVMLEAIKRVTETDNKKLIHLRDTLIGQTAPTFRNEQPIHFPWLNKSQEQAVMKVVNARDVAIVHGPPGTGKTTTLVEAIDETLKREPQVLVSAQSNAAVDWICEQLMNRGIPVLRIGNPMRVSDNLLAATYERRYESHPDYTELWSIRRELREIGTRLRGHLSATERRKADDRIYKLKNRSLELEIRIDAELFATSRVIACTLIGSASKVLERKHFSTLFIDEAAQAFEAACWAAIAKADRVILAGDHLQLPPTIKCFEAERQGLGKTLMEKVADSKPDCVQLLTIQYRMHPAIMQFPSQWFYGGQLQAAPEIANRTTLALDYPLVWIDTAALGFEEEQNSFNLSRLNTSEAKLLVSTLKEYAEHIGMTRLLDERIDFGIISPYKSQVQLLRRLIKDSNDLKPIRSLITVNTVDGFQGQERDVIMISMVRGNDEGRIGFLNDLRRMNVAITRARMKLIILGDTATLNKTAFYHKLIEHVCNFGKMIEKKESDEAKG